MKQNGETLTPEDIRARLINAHPDERDVIERSATIRELIAETLELRQNILTDSLTGARSRRYYEQEVFALWRICSEVLNPPAEGRRKTDAELLQEFQFSIITADIDYFKEVNDKYGHGAGDQLLAQLVGRILKRLRPTDFIARVGGEEFRIIARAINGNACILAEALRRIVAAKPFTITDNEGQTHQITVTISIGVAPFMNDLQTMEACSDEALYYAKGDRKRPGDTDNRNQVWYYKDDEYKRYIPPRPIS